MKILCVTHRQWALNIYKHIASNSDHQILIISSKDAYDQSIVAEFNPDYILYYGWSWLVSKEIIGNFKCVMLHPSPLPKYRGGSPIQNQIIQNEKISMVTLFFMTEALDAGDIILQREISLDGHLSEILARITDVGIKLTEQFLRGDFQPQKQDETQATYCKRRRPSESEITIEELQTRDSTYLFNKIRMLEDPYPNAYIKTIDGKKLLLKFVELTSSISVSDEKNTS